MVSHAIHFDRFSGDIDANHHGTLFTDTNGHYRYVGLREINLSSLHFTDSF